MPLRVHASHKRNKSDPKDMVNVDVAKAATSSIQALSSQRLANNIITTDLVDNISREVCTSSTPVIERPANMNAETNFNSSNQKTLRKDLSLAFNSSTVALPSNRPRHDSATTQAHTPKAKQSWLLRLFESKLFDMSLAITYLFNSKDQGVQVYIGKNDCLSSLISSLIVVIGRKFMLNIHVVILNKHSFELSNFCSQETVCLTLPTKM